MAFLDTALVIIIILIVVLIIWSKIENQRISDTVLEIKDIMVGLAGKANPVK